MGSVFFSCRLGRALFDPVQNDSRKMRESQSLGERIWGANVFFDSCLYFIIGVFAYVGPNSSFGISMDQIAGKKGLTEPRYSGMILVHSDGCTKSRSRGVVA